MPSTRSKVKRVRDKATGQFFLQGRETATKKKANVFGNFRFLPLQSARIKELVYELEVTYCGDISNFELEEYGELFRFSLICWHNNETGPTPQSDYRPGRITHRERAGRPAANAVGSGGAHPFSTRSRTFPLHYCRFASPISQVFRLCGRLVRKD